MISILPFETYALEIPVVEAGPFKLKAPFTRQQLQMTLGAAADRRDQLERINDKAFQVNTSQTQTINNQTDFLTGFQSIILALFTFSFCYYMLAHLPGSGFQKSRLEWSRTGDLQSLQSIMPSMGVPFILSFW